MGGLGKKSRIKTKKRFALCSLVELLFLPNLPFPPDFPRHLPFLLPLITSADSRPEWNASSHYSLYRDVCTNQRPPPFPLNNSHCRPAGGKKERNHDVTSMCCPIVLPCCRQKKSIQELINPFCKLYIYKSYGHNSKSFINKFLTFLNKKKKTININFSSYLSGF